MTEKPPEDEPGAQERFDKGVANALRMPPKPHAAKSKAAPAPKRSRSDGNAT
jgi:hypothetical protein